MRCATTNNMTDQCNFVSLSPDEPLQVGDIVETGDVFGHSATCTVVVAFKEGVYEIQHKNGVGCYIRRAKHKAGVETGIFVYVEKNANGRWVRESTGPADSWACNPKRPLK